MKFKIVWNKWTANSSMYPSILELRDVWHFSSPQKNKIVIFVIPICLISVMHCFFVLLLLRSQKLCSSLRRCCRVVFLPRSNNCPERLKGLVWIFKWDGGEVVMMQASEDTTLNIPDSSTFPRRLNIGNIVECWIYICRFVSTTSEEN